MEGCAVGQVLHGCTTTAEAVRRAIQHSQESLRALAKRCGINQKTVTKRKKQTSCADLPIDRKDARSTILSVGEAAIVVAFRKHTPCRSTTAYARQARNFICMWASTAPRSSPLPRSNI
jgi:hypothetical protein